MKAEILCVGTELLLGAVINTNAPYLARNLAELGIDTHFQGVVGDNRERLAQHFVESLMRSDIVVITGGLGPTYDDITKDVVAKELGLKLQADEGVEQRIKSTLNKLNMPFTSNNFRQSLVPQGAKILPNWNGTAPGLVIEHGDKTVILLPGPPRELTPMVDQYFVPYLRSKLRRTIRSRSVRIFGISESVIEDILHEQMVTACNPTIAPYAKDGEVELRVTASGPDVETCDRIITPIITSLSERFPHNLYGVDVENLQTALVQQLAAKRMRIATAESCTGGMISSSITDVPGASDVFQLGICAYSNHAKHNLLGVSTTTLDEFGAVSAETAIEMADGVRHISGAQIGISTTGLAGPSGGTPETPVGTVYIGIAGPDGTDAHLLHLYGPRENQREWIRMMASKHALFQTLITVTEGDSSKE